MLNIFFFTQVKPWSIQRKSMVHISATECILCFANHTKKYFNTSFFENGLKSLKQDNIFSYPNHSPVKPFKVFMRISHKINYLVQFLSQHILYHDNLLDLFLLNEMSYCDQNFDIRKE